MKKFYHLKFNKLKMIEFCCFYNIYNSVADPQFCILNSEFCIVLQSKTKELP